MPISVSQQFGGVGELFPRCVKAVGVFDHTFSNQVIDPAGQGGLKAIPDMPEDFLVQANLRFRGPRPATAVAIGMSLALSAQKGAGQRFQKEFLRAHEGRTITPANLSAGSSTRRPRR